MKHLYYISKQENRFVVIRKVGPCNKFLEAGLLTIASYCQT